MPADLDQWNRGHHLRGNAERVEPDGGNTAVNVAAWGNNNTSTFLLRREGCWANFLSGNQSNNGRGLTR